MVFDPQLAASFRFGEIDLEWNRRGLLSPDQRAGFLGMISAERRTRPVRMAVALVVFTAAAVVAVVAVRQSKASSTVLAIVIIVLSLVALLIVTMILVSGRRTARITEGHLGVVSGGATVHRRTSGDESGIVMWMLHIGHRKFQISWEGGRAIQPGVLYQAYFLDGVPRGPFLLSLEPMV